MVSRFEKIMILLSIICLSLYGISFLNGNITTAATTEPIIQNSKNNIPEGYFEKNNEDDFDNSASDINSNKYPADVNLVEK